MTSSSKQNRQKTQKIGFVKEQVENATYINP